MKYFSYRGEVVWHILSEGDEPLCGNQVCETVLLAGTCVISEGELTYLDVCEGCRRKHEGTDGL